MTIFDAWINFIVFFKYKETISLIIFIVIGFEIFFKHQISNEAVTLIGVGLLALYLEQLIEKAKKITFFWKTLEWEKDTKTEKE